MSRTRFAAHRGGAALWPENSLRGFRESVALGAPLVELDVHLAADGGLIVIHDRTLERTTDGTGPVADRATEDIGRLRLRGPDGALTDERVPTLDDVLEILAPTTTDLLLEVKGPAVAAAWERAGAGVRVIAGPLYDGLEPRLVERLDAYGMRARTNVLAFNPAVIAGIHQVAPGVRTTLLASRRHVELASARPEDTVAVGVAWSATDVGLEHTLVDASVVGAARRAGLGIGVWTVNDEATIRRLVDLDVDIVTTDRPDIAARVLR